MSSILFSIFNRKVFTDSLSYNVPFCRQRSLIYAIYVSGSVSSHCLVLPRGCTFCLVRVRLQVVCLWKSSNMFVRKQKRFFISSFSLYTVKRFKMCIVVFAISNTLGGKYLLELLKNKYGISSNSNFYVLL